VTQHRDRQYTPHTDGTLSVRSQVFVQGGGASLIAEKNADFGQVDETADPKGIVRQIGEIVLRQVFEFRPRFSFAPEFAIDQR
jgi:hypothetical protein